MIVLTTLAAAVSLFVVVDSSTTPSTDARSDAASDFSKKAKDFAEKHDEQVDQALEKLGDLDRRLQATSTRTRSYRAVDEAQKRTGEGYMRP